MAISRFTTLEFIDLLDPSETRYASIAADMIQHNKWINPQVLTPDGWANYLSKPPLHLWLIGIAFKLFGIDEWTARLPSFLGYLILIGCAYVIAKKIAGKSCALLSASFCAISPLLFFVAGGCIMDITLSAAISLALTSFFLMQSSNKPTFFSYGYFIAAGLAFMIKGPIALVFSSMPVIGFYGVNYLQRKGTVPLRWKSGILIFLAITLPWLLAAEISSPGSIKYFLWNENVLRFLVPDYGDRYGDGHRYPYGTIFIHFFLGFSVPLALFAWLMRKNLSSIKEKLVNSDLGLAWLAFLGLWALGPTLFFSIARNILPSYILPGSTGVAIILGYLTVTIKTDELSRIKAFVGKVTCSIFIAYTLVILVWGTFLSFDKSAEYVLREVVRSENFAEAKAEKQNQIIGVVGTENLSPLWLAQAWENELPQPILIKYLHDQEELDNINADVDHLIVRVNNHGESEIAVDEAGFALAGSYGRWHWYAR